ncbi:AMIN domain-containing protein [Aliarcobacter lanthieri]|uniref:AMIN domain-containing protein n=1 Tax=Aliarcobacter lanthieri TaxID=1355374 RepID=UPI003AAA7704
MVKKELANVKKEPEQIVYVKPRADVETDGKTTTLPSDNGIRNILPFLNIEISDDKLIIKSEHTMFKKFSIDKENKLALDYRAKVSFTTKRENINSKNFKNIVVGNHQKGGYYRVAVELGNKPSKYSVDVKSGTVTISLK